MNKATFLISLALWLIGISMIVYAAIFAPLNYRIDIFLTTPSRFEGATFRDYVYPDWASIFFFGIVFILAGVVVNIEKITDEIFSHL